ncbi:TROVE domain family protein [Acanthocheilonema viteae]
MNIAEYLSSSHPDDLRYRLSIAYAVRNLEQQQSQLVTSVDGNQLSAPWRSDEKFVRRFLIFGNSDGIYFARQTEFTCTLEPGLCRIIQSGKGLMILRQILEVSITNLATNTEPLLIALALCARYKVHDTQSKKKLPWDTTEEREKLLPDAICRDIRPVMEKNYQACLQKSALFAVHKVCATATDLFKFIEYCKVVSRQSGLKKDSNGWGRALRATVIKWYYNHTPNHLAVMVTKYRHRVSYSHRDLFCLSHIHPKQSFPSEQNYWQHQKGYEDIFKHVTRGYRGGEKEEKERKRRKELSPKRKSKRGRSDPEEEERVRQNLEELNLRRTEEREASADGKFNPVIDAAAYIKAFNKLQALAPENINEAITLILQYGFEQEHVPQKLLSSKEVWGALLRRMSLRTMLKNMGKMSGIDLFEEGVSVFNHLSCILGNISSFFYDDCEKYTNFINDNPVSLVARTLTDPEKLWEEQLDPLAILIAKTNYEHGHEMKRNRIWKPVIEIRNAFDKAFYNCMNAVGATNRRYLIAVDISDSMDSFMQGTTVACSQVAAALSMAFIYNETDVITLGFADFLMPLEWNRDMGLGQYLTAAKMLRYGKTDCALPMNWAIEQGIFVDVFIVLTDSDISIKSMKPSDAIQLYRQQMGMPDAKLIIIGITDKLGSLADPTDPNMLVICGINSSVLQVIHDFVLNF